jgi:hypothetical protein
MTVLEQLADRYIAAWNETDPMRRLELVAQTYTEDATYLDPLLGGQGHAGISAMLGAAQSQYPGHRFRRTTSIDTHHDRMRFSWEMAPETGPPLAKGTDICVVDEGRLRSVLGFFDEIQGKAVIAALTGEAVPGYGG